MNIDKHSTIVRLRSSIRSQEAASRDLRAQINVLRLQGPSTGQERCNLHREKGYLASDTRDMLLALAMVRGRSYRTVEQKTNWPPQQYSVAARVLGISLPCFNPEDMKAIQSLCLDVKAWLTADDAAEAPAVTAQTEVAVAA